MAGRPAHKPTEEIRQRVKSEIAMGVTQETVAAGIGISVDTLSKYYREELDTATERACATVAGYLFKTATGKNEKATASDAVRAAIFWQKTRAKWTETDTINNVHQNPDGSELGSKQASAIDELSSILDGIASRVGASGDTDEDGGDESS